MAEETLPEQPDDVTRPPIIEPVVPQTNRRRIEHARVVLVTAPLGRGSAIARIGRRAGVDDAREQNRLAVRSPQRARCAGGQVRHALRFTAAAQVEHIDLWDIVALTPGTERDATAVGTPVHAALTTFGVRQAPRLGAAGGRDEPEIADLLALRVGGLGNREHDPTPIGADRGR